MDRITSLFDEKRILTWNFVGDSITHGAVHTLGWRDYTELFRERLYELSRTEDVTLNTAWSGWTVSKFNGRVEERVLRWKPDAVFMMFGTNDAVGGEEGLPKFKKSYHESIEQMRAAGIERIVVQTTLPMMPLDAAAWTDLGQQPDPEQRENAIRRLQLRIDWIPAYVEATREVAREAGVPLIDHWPVWKSLGGIIGHCTEGAFHPDEYGHRLIAHTIFRELGIWNPATRVCRLPVPT